LRLSIVKVNADLPSTVYLLLFDQEVGAKSISTVLNVNGREYLEKIIQVPFDLPAVGQTQLDRILFADLERALALDRSGKAFNQQRWGNLYYGAMRGYFRTLRQVNRLSSTLSFHRGLFEGHSAFEVNAVDLIAVEVLRVFEPDAYRAVSIAKEALTKVHDRKLGLSDDEVRTTIACLLDLVPAERRDRVKEILKQLFPSAEWAMGGSTYGSDWTNRWYREARVCHPDIFDRYFLLSVPEGDVGHSEIQRVLDAAKDRATLRTEFEALRARGLLDVAIQRFEAYKGEVPRDRLENFITGLFDVGDLLSARKPGFVETAPFQQAGRILYWSLRVEADAAKRKGILLAAANSTVDFSLLVYFVSVQEQALDPDEGHGDDLIERSTLEELKLICCSKIQAAAIDGRLIRSSHLNTILFRWWDWGGAENARAFATSLVREGQVLKFLRAFMSQVLTHAFGSYVGHESYRISLEELERFVPVADLVQATENIDQSSLPPKDSAALGTFRSALDRRGQSTPDFGISDDEAPK